MPKFFTIHYGDRAGYERISPELRAAALAQDERLRSEGALIGVAGEPVQVRNHGGTHLQTTGGQFMSASLPVAGFEVIDAANLEEAIAKVSRVPCAVAYGVVEVWPLK